MPDYDVLLDEETQAFVRKTEQAYPADAASLSIVEQRSLYDCMAQQFTHGKSLGIATQDQAVSALFQTADGYRCPIRLYKRTNRDKSTTENNRLPGTQLIYLHGGGFVVGSLDSHDEICREICQRSGLDVTAVDYRLSPEHHHPAAFHDCLSAVLENFHLHRQPVLLCGDSAGANLCAAIAHRLRGGDVVLAGQILIYPGLGGDMTQGSYIEHANAPMLTTADVAYYEGIRCNEHTVIDVELAPLRDSDFSNLPDTFIVTAQCDPLSDDGRDYKDAILAAGGCAVCVNEPGLVHGYLRARHSVSRAGKSFDRIIRAVNVLASKGDLSTIALD